MESCTFYSHDELAGTANWPSKLDTGAWGPEGIKGCWEWGEYYWVVGSGRTTTTSSPFGVRKGFRVVETLQQFKETVMVAVAEKGKGDSGLIELSK